MCMVFKPKSLKTLSIPNLYLGGAKLNFSDVKKYLGVFISNECDDNADIQRQTKCIYARGNTLITKF